MATVDSEAALTRAHLTLMRRTPRGEALARVRAPLAALAAIAVALLGLLICFEAASGSTQLIPASWHGMPGWLSGALPALGQRLSGTSFAALFLAMCIAFLVALVLADQLSARVAIAAIVVVQIAFALAPPLLSSDVFGYIDWSRMGALHGLDPYTHGSIALRGDAVYPYLRWHTAMPSPYGPLFTLASYALAPLGVAAALWTLKAIAGLAGLATVWLVWASARRLGRPPVHAAVFVGLNPVLLAWALGGAHNDLLATALVAAGIYLSLRARERGGAVALVAATALKVSSVVALPYMLLGSRHRRRALTAAAIAGLGLTAVAAIGLGGDVLGFVGTLKTQQRHIALYSVPSATGHLLGVGGVTTGVRIAFLAILAAVALRGLRSVWRGGDWISAAGWTTLALLVSTAWLLPWYLVWVLPFAALSSDRRLRLATIALGGFMIAVRVGPWLHMAPP